MAPASDTFDHIYLPEYDSVPPPGRVLYSLIFLMVVALHDDQKAVEDFRRLTGDLPTLDDLAVQLITAIDALVIELVASALVLLQRSTEDTVAEENKLVQLLAAAQADFAGRSDACDHALISGDV